MFRNKKALSRQEKLLITVTTLFHTKKHIEAIRVYSKILEPPVTGKKGVIRLAYSFRGRSYRAIRAYEKAFQDFKKLFELKPAQATSYFEIGEVYFDMRNYVKTIENYSKAIIRNH